MDNNNITYCESLKNFEFSKVLWQQKCYMAKRMTNTKSKLIATLTITNYTILFTEYNLYKTNGYEQKYLY